jgi:hypothetical protein
MTRISYDDFKKMVKLLEKETQGGPITIREDGACLKVSVLDREGRELMMEISDISYPFFPKVTRTETF